jgi:transcriptional regulator GlxA family with amidase domain
MTDIAGQRSALRSGGRKRIWFISEMIAAAHHISTRQLHRLFRTHGVTVAAWIRACRLECCRHDLADAAQRSRSVREVAVRWGFTDAAQFSRAFTATYGIGPRDYHRHHHADHTDHRYGQDHAWP